MGYENYQFPSPFGNEGDNGFGNMSEWGNVAEGLGNIFGGYNTMNMENPGNSAMPYYNQIPGQLNSIYSPWINEARTAVNPYLNNGQWAGQNLQGQISSLINNPTSIMNSIGRTFKQSPGYQWQPQQAQNAVNNAAAAGGMAGSPMQQQQSANMVNQFANQDYYNYLNHGIGMYQTGFNALMPMYSTGANIASNMYGTGANMANQYGQNMTEALMNQGNLAYNTQVNQNQQQGQGWGDIFGGLAQAGMSIADMAGFL
jgi:hypothetical protein